jgi:hypothetical protein
MKGARLRELELFYFMHAILYILRCISCMYCTCIHTQNFYALIFFSSVVNMNRARLRPTGTPGADYVNASFIDVRTTPTCTCTTLLDACMIVLNHYSDQSLAWCHFNPITIYFVCRVIRSVIHTSQPRLLYQTLSAISGKWFGSSRANALSCCVTWQKEEWLETMTS